MGPQLYTWDKYKTKLCTSMRDKLSSEILKISNLLKLNSWSYDKAILFCIQIWSDLPQILRTSEKGRPTYVYVTLCGSSYYTSTDRPRYKRRPSTIIAARSDEKRVAWNIKNPKSGYSYICEQYPTPNSFWPNCISLLPY